MATNRLMTQARDAQVIVGIHAHLQNVPSLPLAGTTYTMTELATQVQGRTDLANTVAAARALWLDVTAQYHALNGKLTPVVRGLRQYVINAFGEDSPVLADFGFAPTKKTSLTPAQLVARGQKAAATRKARGTLGPKQKKAIKGTVEVPVSQAPSTTLAPPAPPAQANAATATPVAPVGPSKPTG